MSAAPVLRFGVAGVGNAQRQLLLAMRDHPNIALAAACDDAQGPLDKFASDFGGATCRTVEELCARPDIDAVYVTGANEFHARDVILAAEHRKQVIVEKPIALTMADCDAMIAACDRNGVRLLAGHTHAFDVPNKAMAELVLRGDHGPLVMMNSWYFTDWLRRPRVPDDFDASKGGGVLFRQGPHHIGLARMVGGGMATSVRGYTSVVAPEKPVEASYSASITFAGGGVAHLSFSGYGYFNSGALNWSVGEGGQREGPFEPSLDPAPQGTWDRRPFRPTSVPSWEILTDTATYQPFFGLNVITCERAELRQSPRGILVYDARGMHELVLPAGPLEREAELTELYTAWAEDRPLRFHDGVWARATLEVILGVMQSAKEGRDIPLTRQTRYNV